jgi:hypothetical protein
LLRKRGQPELSDLSVQSGECRGETDRKQEKTEFVREALDRFGCDSELMDELSLITVSMAPTSSIAEALAFLDSESEKGNVGIEESAVRYK